MSLKNRQWHITAAAPDSFTQELACSPTLASVLWGRGYHDLSAVQTLLGLTYPAGIHSPFLMVGMEAAVTRIAQAINAGEVITISGDYDVDGVTSSTLLSEVLALYGATVHVHIPDRREGYGLHASVVAPMQAWGSTLLITVDCGIRSAAEVEAIQAAGITVIITDHHLPDATLPRCRCLNPKIPGYPYPMLAGVGVAFKLISALGARITTAQVRGRDILDLVALGTVADLVPLSGENRILAAAGIRALRESARPGVQALCAVAKVDQATLSATDIGFMLGPRINAAGRMAHASLAYELLRTKSRAVATQLASQLNALNQQRQDLTAHYTAAVMQGIDRAGKGGDPVIVAVVAEQCAAGVVGLIAGKLVEHYGRPALVLRVNGEGRAVGSARSLHPLHIVEALDACADLLDHHGGHAAAAGLTLPVDAIPLLENHLHRFAQSMVYPQTLVADAAVSLADLSWDLVEELDLLEPYGVEHQRPCFHLRARPTSIRALGAKQQHLGFDLTDGPHSIRAVWWNAARFYGPLQSATAFMVHLGVHRWNGDRTLQVEVQDAA